MCIRDREIGGSVDFQNTAYRTPDGKRGNTGMIEIAGKSAGVFWHRHHTQKKKGQGSPRKRESESVDHIEGIDLVADVYKRQALSFYNRVRNHPLSMTKADIQGYFLDMYESVSGHPEEYYSDHPEWIRLINLTICPQ